MDFPVGDWVHLAATYDRGPGEQKIKLFQNAELIATSSAVAEMGALEMSRSPFSIGAVDGSVTSHSSPAFATWSRSLNSQAQSMSYVYGT